MLWKRRDLFTFTSARSRKFLTPLQKRPRSGYNVSFLNLQQVSLDVLLASFIQPVGLTLLKRPVGFKWQFLVSSFLKIFNYLKFFFRSSAFICAC